jgi:ABC-type microcin C transport system duplicated ATPase subunit YejF
LGVARALVRRPALLLLDEATSNVDAATGRCCIIKLVRGAANYFNCDANDIGDGDDVRDDGARL